jgi:3-hydroxyisobutyrate dehydrogenase-like beta-hydroxyacid dehydrogenase
LVKRGFTTLAVDRSDARRGEVEMRGAKWAEPVALALACDVVLVCVGYDREVRALFAADGTLTRMKPGSIVAILSTIHPQTVKEIAAAMQPSAIAVIDSTVCRGGEAADNGTLLSFVGGDADVVAKITPVLQAYSSDVVHTGGVGTAQVAKAANNLVLWACLVADHEALALAQRYGVDVEALRKALMISSSANGPLEKWGTQTMAWAEDDLAIVQEMAADSGLSLPQAGLNREICRVLKPKRYKIDQYGI